MTAMDVGHVCDSCHSHPQVPILMMLVMCLPSRLAERLAELCRRISKAHVFKQQRISASPAFTIQVTICMILAMWFPTGPCLSDVF